MITVIMYIFKIILSLCLIFLAAHFVSWKRFHKNRELEDKIKTLEKELKKENIQYEELKNALNASESQKNAILNGIKVNIAFVDENLSIIWTNRTAAESVNRSQEEMIGHRCHEFWDNPEKPCNGCPTVKSFLTGKTEHSIIKTTDGRIWDEKGEPVFNETGELIGVIEIAHDITEKSLAVEALKESEAKYRSLFESLNDAAVLTDAKTGIILEINKQAETLWGYSKEELIGLQHTRLHPPDQEDTWRQHFQRSFILQNVTGFDSEISKKDGTPVPVIISATVFKFQERDYIMGLFLDITDRKETEKAISASLKEKEVLLREIHHRVKNNMQIVISLLNLQARQIKDKQILEIFQESQNRIRAMALIHETLFQSPDLSRVDSGIYINKLANALFQVFGTGHQQIELIVAAEGIFLAIDDAVPIGLVINELLTNALKYAFPDDRRGKIKIIMHITGDKIELSVVDNGQGLPEAIDFEDTKTLGLILVKGLVEDQLEGELNVIRDNGTCFIIRFTPKRLI